MSTAMRWLPFLAAFGYVLAASAQGTGTTNTAPLRVPALEANQHINIEAIVTGKVAEVNVAERLVRLNFERPYPSNTFTAVIFANKTNLFPNVRELKDKTVEVTGKIADYRGRPEIILTSTNQLKVVELESGASPREKKE
jgi:DNA/RNA endonuclease YhcR with UshA esterase domain